MSKGKILWRGVTGRRFQEGRREQGSMGPREVSYTYGHRKRHLVTLRGEAVSAADREAKARIQGLEEKGDLKKPCQSRKREAGRQGRDTKRS